MVETALAVTVLGTLLAALPALLALQDADRTAHRAAFAASLMSAWKGTLAPEVLDRRLRTELEALPWLRPADERRVVDPGRAGGNVAEAAPPGRAAALLAFIAEPLDAAGGYRSADFSLNQQGFHTATIRVHTSAIAGAPQPFDSLELDLAQSAAALTDTWNAAGSDMVVRRVSGLVPTRLLGESSDAVRAFRGVLSVVEPAFERFCPGRIDAEALPASRLDGAMGLAARRSSGACE